VEEFAQEARESGEILSRHRAGFKNHKAAIVQKIAQCRSKLATKGLPVEFESRNHRADCRLQLGNAHSRRHGGFRNEPDNIRGHEHLGLMASLAASTD